MNHYIITQAPISVNQAYMGRKVKTPAYRNFLEIAAWELKSQKPKLILTPIAVEIILHLKNVKKSDIDNRLKSVLDAGTKAGLWKDDSQIYDLVVSKTKTNNNQDWVEILVRKYVIK